MPTLCKKPKNGEVAAFGRRHAAPNDCAWLRMWFERRSGRKTTDVRAVPTLPKGLLLLSILLFFETGIRGRE